MKNFKKYILVFSVFVSVFTVFPSMSLAQQIQTSPNSFNVPVSNPINSSNGGIITSPNAVTIPISNPINTSTAGNGPTIVSCSLGASPKLADLFNYITCIINGSVLPLIITLALVSFVWGVVQYVINTDEEAKRAKGRQFMIWGIVALTVMISVWGLVSLVGGSFGIQNVIPRVNTQ